MLNYKGIGLQSDSHSVIRHLYNLTFSLIQPSYKVQYNTVLHKMVGLERMSDYRGVGLQRFHCIIHLYVSYIYI